jgi:hypothetical protein
MGMGPGAEGQVKTWKVAAHRLPFQNSQIYKPLLVLGLDY